MTRRLPTARVPTVRTEALINLAFALVRLVVLLYLMRLTAIFMNPAGAGLFLLARRIATTGAGFAQLGTTQTLLRFMSLHSREHEVRASYAALGILFAALLIIVGVPFAWLASDWLGTLFFAGQPGASDLAFWTSITVVVTVAGFIANSQHIAERKVWSANALRMLLIGGAGVIALLWLQSGAEPVATMRLSALILGLGVGATILAQLARLRLPPASFRKNAPEALRSFVRYGLPRGLVAGLDTLTALIGPWLLRDQPEEAGFLIIAYSLLRIMDAAILPAMQVVATAGARAMGTGNHALMTQAVRWAVGSAALFGTLAIAFLLPWLDRILYFWLGNEVIARGSYEYARWIILGILPLCIYLTLRQIIEIRYIAPLNLITHVSGITAILSAYFIGTRLGLSPESALIIGLLGMETARGALSIIWVRKDLRDVAYFGFGRLGVGALAIGTIQAFAAGHGAVWAFAGALLLSIGILYVLLVKYPSAVVVDIVARLSSAKT